MSLQAQPKSSSKRAGKRIAFFNEQGLLLKEAQQQLLKEGQYFNHGGNVPSSQGIELSKSGIYSGVPSNAALLNSVYQDRGEARMISQQLSAAKWQNSLMGNRLPECSDGTWQPQPGGWNHGMVYGGSQKVGHPNANIPSFYNHPDALKRNQEKGVVVSQLDLYGGAVQQMMSQKAQLEQQALVRQQAQINSFQQMQKQQQQQQQQNQSLPLQPFQLAFGHQGQKQGLPELLHVFQQAPPTPTPAFTTQQTQQALPQLQLFENFYPQQQQQHHQQQAVVQAFGIQQPASATQPRGAAPPQPPQHHMVSHQFHPVPDRNQELLKALTEPNPQTVLPQAQIPLPRRSRRLSKESVLSASSAEEALASKPAEEYSGNMLPHHWQPQQHPEVQFRHQPEPFSHNKETYSQLNRAELELGEMPPDGQPGQPEMEKVGTYENARQAEKQVATTERANDFGGVRSGVIQSTRRRRRVSQEANLLTLAQKAVELASLQNIKEPEASEERSKSEVGVTAPRSVVEFAGSSPAPKRGREDSSLVPLIIPVSVPVRRLDCHEVGSEKGEDGKLHHFMINDHGLSESKPSVIVTRRRSNRNLNMDMSAQHEGTAPKEEMEGFARKPKQRPRPEPLFIPPKAGTFIVPPVYANITPYQSHLRSPVRLADHPSDRNFELPPYTPPPILSPVREGSGLYFNAILSASGNSVPPPMTPKSAHRTLLRSNSAEVTPPVLSVMGECTPVSIEPRINVGSRFQAEIPALRDRSLATSDKAKAELVWQPWEEHETDMSTLENVENLLTAACSSVFPGGGTNQELAFHCLHETKGNILAALTKMLLKRSIWPASHPLADYHYTGSDKWSTLEKKLFNKGIAIYKKDFFLVQKLIKTKTVAQCVEFYYTYKKQVKIGRNGTLIFGDVDVASERAIKDEAEVDIKSSHRLTRTLPPRTYNEDYENTEDEEEEEEADNGFVIKQEVIEADELHDKNSTMPLKPIQALHTEDQVGSLLTEKRQEPAVPRVAEARGRTSRRTKEMPIKYRKTSPPAQKRKRKPKPKQDTTNKAQNQEEEFPCKKCGRVFYKVKSRSAHMKSHAEQEKKAAALKQREKEEAEAAEAAAAARNRAQREESSDSGSSSGSSSSSSSSDEDGEV
ncbi:mitotic deacetylase-associated SANT domain protein [Rhineura floridana]|uniref:mitotic deacetylase-associated SANT domain protein n=1 Tax=Rhineura floridana TaxID=261503 RepID=UPI002AC8523F|nr:mitotic deacetylase-associated SANT domain protein [Rhineura floridana]XP_061467247.1 mitotic deacetylase-associated SANT domain protein [Rhineura floridana]XP_061467248.1 mitotic deacetylase-associated SANT domain protein [Rhineura floridana]